MFWLNFYQIAYIAKLIVFLSLCRLLFPVESKTESGIFTNILYPNSFVKNEIISVNESKCSVYYLCNSTLNNYSG